MVHKDDEAAQPDPRELLSALLYVLVRDRLPARSIIGIAREARDLVIQRRERTPELTAIADRWAALMLATPVAPVGIALPLESCGFEACAVEHKP